jgi:hypothetical protein
MVRLAFLKGDYHVKREWKWVGRVETGRLTDATATV